MSSRHLSADEHVRRLKKWTRNSDQLNLSGDTVEGIDTDFIVMKLNEGKEQIQAAIANLHTDYFVEWVAQAAVASTRLQSIPARALNSNRIIKVEYSSDGSEDRYIPLNLKSVTELAYSEGPPANYAIVGSNILVEPVPTEVGYFRFLLQVRDPNLDVRRGIVESISQSGGYLDTITLVDDSYNNAVNQAALANAEWVTAVNYKGDIILDEIAVASYNDSSRTLTMQTDAVAYNNELITGTFYLVIGDRASTHSQMPVETQKYYVEWAKTRIMYFDSNKDAVASLPFLKTIRNSILESLGEQGDMQQIPQYGSLTGNWG